MIYECLIYPNLSFFGGINVLLLKQTWQVMFGVMWHYNGAAVAGHNDCSSHTENVAHAPMLDPTVVGASVAIQTIPLTPHSVAQTNQPIQFTYFPFSNNFWFETIEYIDKNNIHCSAILPTKKLHLHEMQKIEFYLKATNLDSIAFYYKKSWTDADSRMLIDSLYNYTLFVFDKTLENNHPSIQIFLNNKKPKYYIEKTTEKPIRNTLFMEQCIAICYWLLKENDWQEITTNILKSEQRSGHLGAIFGTHPNDDDATHYSDNVEEAAIFAFQAFIFATEITSNIKLHKINECFPATIINDIYSYLQPIPSLRKLFLKEITKKHMLTYAIKIAEKSIPNTDFFIQLKNTQLNQ